MDSKNLMGTLRSKNISEVIIDRIVASLLSEELRPGERLPSEEEFAERLGVGRSSVREAMKILEAMGIVEIRRADGTYIVDELNERMLNPLVLGMLVAEKSSADICRFKVLVQGMGLEELMSQPKDIQLEPCIALVDAIERDPHRDPVELNALLSEAEACLARGIANPLVRFLYRRTILIASHLQLQALRRGGAEGCLKLTTHLRDLISAVERRDRESIRGLLDGECLWLSSGTN